MNKSVYRIRRCPVSPISFAKSWSLTIWLKKFIFKILGLEINSRKIFLFFLFIRYDTTIIQFFFIFLISLLLQTLNEVSQSNIFVFFFYIWSSKVNNIFIISGSAFWSVSSISIDSFTFSSFFSELLLSYLIQDLATGLPVTNFCCRNIGEIVCFYCITTRSNISGVTSIT